MHRTSTRAGQRGTLVALAALLLLSWTASSAHAADAYRYWSYWWGGADSAWEYAQSGPADRVVADGDVEGWRFLVSAEAVPTQQPGAAADFEGICGSTEPVAGEVRVAVVIDFGDPADAPEGSTYPDGDGVAASCVSVPEGSTGEQALAAAAQVRSEQGATCGIDGYPATGCFDVVAAPATTGEAVTTAEAADDAASSANGWVWVLAAGAAVLAALGLLLTLRNRKSSAA